MKKAIIIICILFMLFLITLGNYTFILNQYWGLSLPSHDWILCHETSSTSFLGDGKKYTIFNYHFKWQFDQIEKINWKYEKNRNMETQIKQILDKIEYDKKFDIDFEKDYGYYIKKRYDNSELYMLYDQEQHIIYIVESIS